MPFSPEVEAARAQVFQLVGRNVLRFQRIELMLKDMVAKSRISVTGGESPTAYERRVEATNKKTLGLLAGQFFDEAVSDQPPSDDSTIFPEEAKAEASGKIHTGVFFRLHLPGDAHAHWKARLQKLIEERNELVHTSLLRMELETLAGCQQALASLEEQASRVLAEIEKLRQFYQSTVELQKTMGEWMVSDEFAEMLLNKKK